MSRLVLCAAVVAIGLGTIGVCTQAVEAAEITHAPLGKDGKAKAVELILVQGDILPGDEQRFRNLSVRYDNAVIALNSPGGSLLPAIEIGKMVHLKEYPTLVAKNDSCTSACALIWVAGSTRFLSPTGRVGFHASYKDESGQKEETGVGNALVGHYLGLLSLPEKAIVFATSASPNQIEWLTADNMRDAGIEFESFEDAPEPPPLVRTRAAPVASAPAPSTRPHGWVQVAASARVKEFIDFDRIANVGSYKSAWVKADHSSDPTVNYFRSSDLWYFDCQTRRIALKAFVNYDRQGQSVDSHEVPDYSLQWESVVPDSIGESKLDLVCE